MHLINPCNEAFVPLIEDYFAEKVLINQGSESKILKFHRLMNQQTKSILLTGRSICIGSDAYENGIDIIFVWEVRDVIKLITENAKYDKDSVTILCNLVTHISELKAAGFNVLPSPYEKLGRCVPNISLKDEDFKMLRTGLSSVHINPNSETDETLFMSRAIVKYKEDVFSPNDENYSNEFCECYQIASILQIPLYVATNPAELKSIKAGIRK